MVFLRATNSTEIAHRVEGRGVMLQTPTLANYAEWAALRAASRAFLTPWEPIWPGNDLTRAAFRRRIRRYHSEMRADDAYPFFIFRNDDGALVGGLTLSNIKRGMTQSTTMGYWMGERFAGRGLMTEAVRAIIPFAFEALRLHRIEAACLPANAASIRLLEKLGFQREGLARGLVCINGRWQDHHVFALLADDERP